MVTTFTGSKRCWNPADWWPMDRLAGNIALKPCTTGGTLSSKRSAICCGAPACRSRLLAGAAADPIPGTRLRLFHFRRITDGDFDSVESALVFVVGPVGDHILAVQLGPDLL